MSTKVYDNDVTVLIPTDGTILVSVTEADRINFLNFQVISTLSGGSVDVTFTVERTNDPKTASSWKTAGVSKNYNVAGSNNDMLEVAWASAAAYRLKITIVAGVAGSVRVVTIGKG